MTTSTSLTDLWNGMAFSLPFQSVALVLGILMLCMVWGRFKLGLVTAFGTFMYWAFQANLLGMLRLMEENMVAMLAGIFVVLSLSILILMTLFEENL